MTKIHCSANGVVTRRGKVRFLNKIDRNGPVSWMGSKCWVWQGYVFADGYGGFCDHYWFTRSHRYSWITHNGQIPEELEVLHHCDNPLCVNPKHLYLGTPLDNKLDSVAKGRHARGERHGEAKLTDDKVRKIRKIYRKGKRGYGAVTLARRFGVSKPVILGIINGTGWKHVV